MSPTSMTGNRRRVRRIIPRDEQAAFAADVAAPQTTNMDELATSVGGMYDKGSYRFPTYDPNVLAYPRGKSLKIYAEMQTHASVWQSLEALKLGILAGGIVVNPASEDRIDLEIADFIRWVIADINGSFVWDVLYGALDCLAMRAAFAEKVYKLIDKGPWRGKIGLLAIKDKDPEWYGFDVDDYLNVQGLILCPGGVSAEGPPLPIDKFVVTAFRRKYGQPRGVSLLRAAYKHWFSADHLIRMWNLFLEKYGMPTLMMLVRPGVAQDPALKAELLSLLDSVYQDSGILLPEDLASDIKRILDAPSPQVAYTEAVRYHDQMIRQAILLQTLTSGEGERVGSLALGQVHRDTFATLVGGLQEQLEDSVVREQIIRDLVDKNWAGVDDYPTVTIGLKEERDLAQIADAIYKLATAGFVDPEDPEELRNIREMAGLPAPTDAMLKHREAKAAAGPTPADWATGVAQGGGGA